MQWAEVTAAVEAQQRELGVLLALHASVAQHDLLPEPISLQFAASLSRMWCKLESLKAKLSEGPASEAAAVQAEARRFEELLQNADEQVVHSNSEKDAALGQLENYRNIAVVARWKAMHARIRLARERARMRKDSAELRQYNELATRMYYNVRYRQLAVAAIDFEKKPNAYAGSSASSARVRHKTSGCFSRRHDSSAGSSTELMQTRSDFGAGNSLDMLLATQEKDLSYEMSNSISSDMLQDCEHRAFEEVSGVELGSLQSARLCDLNLAHRPGSEVNDGGFQSKGNSPSPGMRSSPTAGSSAGTTSPGYLRSSRRSTSPTPRTPRTVMPAHPINLGARPPTEVSVGSDGRIGEVRPLDLGGLAEAVRGFKPIASPAAMKRGHRNSPGRQGKNVKGVVATSPWSAPTTPSEQRSRPWSEFPSLLSDHTKVSP